MRELVIVIHDLYLAPAARGESSPLPLGAGESFPGLQHIARFGRKSAIDGSWRSWLARWLGRDDLASAAPAAIATAALGAPPLAVARESRHDSGTAWFASPVHLIAGLTTLHLDRRSILSLGAADLAQLAQDFRGVFGELEFSLEPATCDIFIMRIREGVEACTIEPARAVVAELEAALPTGPGATVLRRLGAELEMWLHGHPLNQRRTSRGELPVSTLWLWGGGAAQNPQTLLQNPGAAGPRSRGDVALGSDPYLTGLRHLLGLEQLPLPVRFPNLSSYPEDARMALVAGLTPLLQANPHWTIFQALADFDQHFIAPAVAALRAGEVASVRLIANDVQLHVNRRDALKLWRRRPGSAIDALRG